MTILVTGGSGILGRPLIRNLLQQGHEVIGLCRTPPEEKHRTLRWLKGDVSKPMLGLDEQTWRNLETGLSAIFHLAARTDFSGKNLQEYAAVNIDGVQHIKELALSSGAWLHHVSTAFVCGDWQGEFREDQLRENQSFHNHYEESKYCGECVLRRDPAPQFTVYRPAIILERAPTTKSLSAFGPFVFLDGVFRICLGMIKHSDQLETLRVDGDPDASLPFVFDDEVAETLAQLARDTSIAGRTYHLTPREPFANHLLEKIFNEAFGRQVVRMVKDGLKNGAKPSTAERILAKRTKMYQPYMALNTTFGRENTDERYPAAIPAIDDKELLTAFSLFLATKKDVNRVVRQDVAFHIGYYFNHFLSRHAGQPLIKNLSSLSARLHIEISGHSSWTITIEKGVLTTIEEGNFGDFGYCTDGDTFLQIAAGRRSPQQLFFKGAIQLIGNPREALRTATALEEFFKEYPYDGNS